MLHLLDQLMHMGLGEVGGDQMLPVLRLVGCVLTDMLEASARPVPLAIPQPGHVRIVGSPDFVHGFCLLQDGVLEQSIQFVVHFQRECSHLVQLVERCVEFVYHLVVQFVGLGLFGIGPCEEDRRTHNCTRRWAHPQVNQTFGMHQELLCNVKAGILDEGDRFLEEFDVRLRVVDCVYPTVVLKGRHLRLLRLFGYANVLAGPAVLGI
mmetsp:Transcript_79359/g.227667  ORF Transcript_79359/g.227667 Transcript_79359/m.227667 type:complete len:208 (-) Transcript_79359:245-868(-)